MSNPDIQAAIDELTAVARSLPPIREHATDGIDCWCAPTCRTPDGRTLSRSEAEMMNAVGEVMHVVHNEPTEARPHGK